MANQLTRAALLSVSILLLGLVAAVSRADAPAAGKLVVTVAAWGDLPDGKNTDITAKVAALVKNNSLSIKADKATLGDPASGASNKLKVGYTVDGVYKSKTVSEGDVLDISTRLIITKAMWGDLASSRNTDVTDIVADLVRANALTFDASNDLFGDPAEGTVKHLKLDYTLDGVAGSVTADENQTIKIPAK